MIDQRRDCLRIEMLGDVGGIRERQAELSEGVSYAPQSTASGSSPVTNGTHGTDGDVERDEGHGNFVQHLIARDVPEIVALAQE